ncbi:MAG: OmpH family outer membrane protein [Sphingomonadales bacterium]|nr:OmpH family outer membrane protein [Sphingomonadales bacterium]
MKILLKSIVAAFIMITGFTSAPVQAADAPQTRIIIVDFVRVTAESLVGKDVAAQIESHRINLDNRANQISGELKAENEELVRKQEMLKQKLVTQEVFEAEVREFNQKRQNAELEIRQKNQQLGRAAQQVRTEMERTVRPIVMKIMEEKKANIVMDSGILYHNAGGIDVTTEVIDRLNVAMSSYKVQMPE